MNIKTSGRELAEGVDRVCNGGLGIGELPDTLRPALARALSATAGLLDTQTDPDREFELSALVDAELAMVSIKRGKSLAPPIHSDSAEVEAIPS